MGADPLRSRKALVNRFPRSARTIVWSSAHKVGLKSEDEDLRSQNRYIFIRISRFFCSPLPKFVYWEEESKSDANVLRKRLGIDKPPSVREFYLQLNPWHRLSYQTPKPPLFASDVHGERQIILTGNMLSSDDTRDHPKMWNLPNPRNA
jgi:hypothetical protein